MKCENCTRLTARVAELEAGLGRMMADNSKLEIRVGELEEFALSFLAFNCSIAASHELECPKESKARALLKGGSDADETTD